MSMQLISSSYYEIFEIHKLPRNLIGLTLEINRKGAKQWVDQQGTFIIPVNALTFVISKDGSMPKYANFLFTNKNTHRLGVTKSFNYIHKYLDSVKEALNNPNLIIYMNDVEIPPYIKGVSYIDKGIYQGIYEDTDGKYHYFGSNNKFHKEYIND